MKRFTTLTVIFTVAVLTLLSAIVFAQDEPAAPTRTRQHAFVDENGDGVCDNYTGTGEGKGRGLGYRSNFVDADGDGVCDNAGSGAGQKLRNGTGRQSCNGTCNGTSARNKNSFCNGKSKGGNKNRSIK